MKTLIPAAALATLYSCAPVWADTLQEPRSVTVHFEDLNINSPRGAAVLYQRIRSAAEDVCGNPSSQRSVAIFSRYATCVRGAIAGAVARVNLPHSLPIVRNAGDHASRINMRQTISDLHLSE